MSSQRKNWAREASTWAREASTFGDGEIERQGRVCPMLGIGRRPMWL